VDVEALEERKARCTQHGGPEDAVRLQDVLGHHVFDAAPALLKGRIIGIAEAREVVDERIEPHVADVVLVEGKLDAPFETRFRTRDAEVLETALVAQHGQNLVAVALGTDQVRLLLECLHEPVEVAAHLEEVVRFDAPLGRAFVIPAQAVHHVPLGEEALAADAVEAFVLAKLDLSGVVHGLEDRVDRANVIRIGGADETVEAHTELLPGRPVDPRDLLGQRPGGNAALRGDLRHLFPVLVGSSQEEGLLPRHAVVTRERVDDDGGVGVADVGLGVHVVDRCGDGEAAAHRMLASRSASSARSATIWGLALRWIRDLRQALRLSKA
jgi:hypothetical protein